MGGELALNWVWNTSASELKAGGEKDAYANLFSDME